MIMTINERNNKKKLKLVIFIIWDLYDSWKASEFKRMGRKAAPVSAIGNEKIL